MRLFLGVQDKGFKEHNEVLYPCSWAHKLLSVSTRFMQYLPKTQDTEYLEIMDFQEIFIH